MAKFDILAGDFKVSQNNSIMFGSFQMPKSFWSKETVWFVDIEEIEEITSENVHTVARTTGWAIAGAVVAGPLGLLAAGYVGGKKKTTTVRIKLKDGRGFIAAIPTKIYDRIIAHRKVLSAGAALTKGEGQ